MPKTQSEKTSAEDKSIGFDFQYYFFLLGLLNLKGGETIGLEVLDDVHTELTNDKQILMQVKHTVQTKADGSSKNLTTLDTDLWKTLSNWAQVISDENSERLEKKDQLKFLRKTKFLLATNKSDNEKNLFLKNIKEFQNETKTYEDLRLFIENLKNETKDKTLQENIETILSLDNEINLKFFKNLAFELGVNDIIDQCKLAIKEKMILENKIDQVFWGLDSDIRADNFLSVQNKKKIIISFDNFYKKYRKHFDLGRNDKLKFIKFDGGLPKKFEEQIFIRQLIEINDIDKSDYENMAKFTRYRLEMENNLDSFYKNGDITKSEMEDFDDESKIRWGNEFHSIYGSNEEDDDKVKARTLLKSIRKEKLPIANQELLTRLSNGQYYRLSNIPEIGWEKNWEEKYK